MAQKKGKFSEKYGPNEKPDPAIKEKILERTQTDEVPCTVAFEIVQELGISPSEVGKTIDLMEYRIVKCQLGLFGYKPGHSIVEPKLPENDQIAEAIKTRAVNEKLACATAWEIATLLDVPKTTVGNACEALNIKIKPCQLGAF